MFTLYVRDSFAAAHRLEVYHGKCEELHGHNFKVEAFVEGRRIRRGRDAPRFRHSQIALQEILAGLDHKYINEIPFFKERASSSEWLALYFYGSLKAQLEGRPLPSEKCGSGNRKTPTRHTGQ